MNILYGLYHPDAGEILLNGEPVKFAIIESLKGQGTSIVFISHKLHEVLEVADRISVLRRGRKIDTVPREGATEESLARMMVGREVLLRVEKGPHNSGESLLEVK